MSRIVVDFQPFAIEQKVYTYSDEGTIIEKAYCSIDEVTDTVKAMQNKFSAKEVDLIGNSDYLTKFKNGLKTNFDFTDVNINIIGR